VPIGASYPAFQLPGTGWVGSTIAHNAKCKCCAGDVAEELLELLVKRAAGKKVKGVELTYRGIPDYFAQSDRGFSKQSLMNHMRSHVSVQKLVKGVPQVADAPGKAVNVTKLNAERERALREAVAADVPEVSDDDDFRGPHVAYLERVVRIAAKVVEQFPERVTPEMGIRASAEIAKMRQNDSRDALLDMLVQTAVASPSKIARVGQAAIVRELDTGEVQDAEIVHEGEA
jgi:hypothetical protein